MVIWWAKAAQGLHENLPHKQNTDNDYTHGMMVLFTQHVSTVVWFKGNKRDFSLPMRAGAILSIWFSIRNVWLGA